MAKKEYKMNEQAAERLEDQKADGVSDAVMPEPVEVDRYDDDVFGNDDGKEEVYTDPEQQPLGDVPPEVEAVSQEQVGADFPTSVQTFATAVAEGMMLAIGSVAFAIVAINKDGQAVVVANGDPIMLDSAFGTVRSYVRAQALRAEYEQLTGGQNIAENKPS